MSTRGSPIPRENLRPAVHLSFGLAALLLRFLSPAGALAFSAAALFHNLVLLPRYARILWRPEDESRGFAIGIVLYPTMVLGLVLLFWDRLHLAAAAWGVLAFGDGFAAFVGRNLRGPRLPWNPEKTWSGSLSFFTFGTIGAAMLLSFVSQRPDQGPSVPFALALIPCGVAALAGALVESSRLRLDDNLTVTIVTAGILAAWAAVDPVRLAEASPELAARLPVGIAVNAVLGIVALGAKTVDWSGFLAGIVLATLTWVAGGWEAFLVFLAFFVLGSAATRFGRSVKENRGVAQARGGRRSHRQAFANTSIGAVLAFLAVATGRRELFLLGLTGAFATAAFDTVASEIGQVYGRHPVLITSGRPVPVGTEGAVSREGTWAGALAAIVVGVLGAGLGLYPWHWIGAVVLGAAVGTTMESLGGACLGRRGLLGHETANFLNTAIGAGVCLALGALRGL